MKLLTRDISISRLFPSGCVECSAIVDNTYYHRRYMDYTLTEAVRLFREYVEAAAGRTSGTYDSGYPAPLAPPASTTR